jgi:hypothetical protein
VSIYLARFIFQLCLVVFFFSFCKESIPLSELTSAKQELSKAKVFLADKYASGEYDEARSSLLKSHGLIQSSEKNWSEARKLASYASAKARDSIERSISFLIPKTREDSEASFMKSEMAMGDVFDPTVFSDLVKLYGEAKEQEKQAEGLMRHYPYIENDEELEESREKAFSLYYVVYQKYLKVQKLANEAYLHSTEKIDTILSEYSGTEKELEILEAWQENSEKENIANLKREYFVSVQAVKEGNIRKGLNSLQKIKASTDFLVFEVLIPKSENRLFSAKERLLALEKKRNQFNSPNSEPSPQLAKFLSDYAENHDTIEHSISQSLAFFIDGNYAASFDRSSSAHSLLDNLELSLSTLPPAMETTEKIEQDDTKDKKTRPNRKRLTKVERIVITTQKVLTYKDHRVQKRDTLKDLAKKESYQQSSHAWREIYQINKSTIKNPHLIYPHQTIKIPVYTEVISKETFEEDVEDIQPTEDEQTLPVRDDEERTPRRKVKTVPKK